MTCLVLEVLDFLEFGDGVFNFWILLEVVEFSEYLEFRQSHKQLCSGIPSI